ncbi:hypothetical protein Cgig2_017091 [Carnegiea gigantea]|uniref:Uncharacterized protein n=1 Tax=Carnegiea gigantea TaxID=171969 RepID=A0A9Q1QBH8_9CARY|nr:hypothetical protein Cgig2_017091 [Carnegiea gigantea]
MSPYCLKIVVTEGREIEDIVHLRVEVEITNPIEIQEGDDEEIPLVRDDVEPNIVDADIVDADLVDANFNQDNNDENDEDVVVVPQNQPQPRIGDIILNDVQPPLTYRQKRIAQQALRNVRKRRPPRGLKLLREREQNPNVKPFAKITLDIERVVGKNANRFIGTGLGWIKRRRQDCWIKSRHKDRSWDPNAAAKYEEFKELHMSQIEKEGADNLSFKEADLLVIKEKPGYHRGLVHNLLEKVEENLLR